jgi:hypothetical protein
LLERGCNTPAGPHLASQNDLSQPICPGRKRNELQQRAAFWMISSVLGNTQWAGQVHRAHQADHDLS